MLGAKYGMLACDLEAFTNLTAEQIERLGTGPTVQALMQPIQELNPYFFELGRQAAETPQAEPASAGPTASAN